MRTLRTSLAALAITVFALAPNAARAQDASVLLNFQFNNIQQNPLPGSVQVTQPITLAAYTYARLTYSATVTSTSTPAVLSNLSIEGLGGLSPLLASLGIVFTLDTCNGVVNTTVDCAAGVVANAFAPTMLNLAAIDASGTITGGGRFEVITRLDLWETNPTVVPDPATLALVAGGLAALGLAVRRRQPRS